MTRTLKLYGASDDLFEIEGTRRGEPDEIGCFDQMEGPPAVLLQSTSEGGRLVVIASYAPGQGKKAPATWAIGLAPADENVPLPSWPMRWALGGRGYTTELQIDVPDDTTVEQLADAQ